MKKIIIHALTVLFSAILSLQVFGIIFLRNVLNQTEKLIVIGLFAVYLIAVYWIIKKVEARNWATLASILAVAVAGTIVNWVLQVFEFYLFTKRLDVDWAFNPFEDEFSRAIYFVFPALLIGEILRRYSWKFSAGLSFLLLAGMVFWLKSGFSADENMHFPPIAASDSTHPNIVLILVDDFGYSDLSAYGNTMVKTPNIDAIGANGVRFTAGYCTAPLCAPSRAGLITGRYQQRFGFEGQPDPLPFILRDRHANFKNSETGTNSEPQEPWWANTPIAQRGIPQSETTLPELLKTQGYRTALFGKWHGGIHPNFSPLNCGFDAFYGFPVAASLYADRNDTSIVTRPPTNNIVEKMHDQLYYYWMTDGKKDVRDEVPHHYQTDVWTQKSVDFIEKSKNERFFLMLDYNAVHTPLQAPKKYYNQLSHIKDPDIRAYYAMILSADEGVGRVMDKLKTLNLSKNTLVIFTSDNGGAAYIGFNASTLFRGGKLTHFEGGLRIPFMMQWQGHILPNTVYDKPVSHLDIFQTVAKATNSTTNNLVLDGKDLISFLNKPTEAPHDTLFWRNVYSKAVRVDSLKLYVNDKNKVSYLFDLKNDASETTDLSATRPADKKRLEAILADWEKGMKQPLWRHTVNYSISGGDKNYYFAN